MKAAEYVRIHRLVSGLTAKSIWEHLVRGGTLDELKRDLPEEFHGFIDDNGKAIMRDAAAVVSEVHLAVDDLESILGERIDMLPRKDVALAVHKHYPRLAKYVFLVLDGEPLYPVALASVKPQREASLVTEV